MFECTAEGDPTPTIRWSRQNGRLPPFSSSENGLLSIFPTNLEDGGAYVCTAANAIGADGVLVTLTVERGIVKKPLWNPTISHPRAFFILFDMDNTRSIVIQVIMVRGRGKAVKPR